MRRIVTMELACTLMVAVAGCSQPSTLALALPGCSAGQAGACESVKAQLERAFGSGDDHALAKRLAGAAVTVVQGEAAVAVETVPTERQLLVTTLKSCGAKDVDACDQVARVLAGLFTGADAQLAASSDGRFARSFAQRILEVAGFETTAADVSGERSAVVARR